MLANLVKTANKRNSHSCFAEHQGNDKRTHLLKTNNFRDIAPIMFQNKIMESFHEAQHCVIRRTQESVSYHAKLS